MRALVTGGDGFVGQYLLRELTAAGAEVVASVQRLPPRPSILHKPEVGVVTWKQADIQEADPLFRLIASERPPFIFHLAGYASGALARQAPEQALTLNAVGTLNLCSATARVREEFSDYAPRIVIMGSAEAYGFASDVPLSEEMPLRPASPYGLSKACQELVAHSFRRWKGLETIVARTFNLLGPGQARPFVVPDLSHQAAAIAARDAEPVMEVGNLDVERDFTDVRDAVRALRVIAELEAPSRVYNVCSGQPVAIRQLLAWILEEAEVEVDVRPVAGRMRSEEKLRVVGDPGLLKRHTGWKPRRRVEESVREVYRWTKTLL